MKFGAMGDAQARLKFKDNSANSKQGVAEVNEEFHFQLYDIVKGFKYRHYLTHLSKTLDRTGWVVRRTRYEHFGTF